MSACPDFFKIFDEFQVAFNEEHSTRDSIRDVTSALETEVRQAVTILQSVHFSSSSDEDTLVTGKAREHLSNCRGLYERLAQCVPQGEYYRYNDHWRQVTQRAVFSLALLIFLENNPPHLATRQEVADFFGLKTKLNEGFILDLEDYLHGLLLLATDLSRLSVNSAARGDYAKPLAISKLVNELNAGFRLINFKNDSLRKHYDCLKYDLKKIEEVVYDLSIRGLKPTSGDGDTVSSEKPMVTE